MIHYVKMLVIELMLIFQSNHLCNLCKREVDSAYKITAFTPTGGVNILVQNKFTLLSHCESHILSTAHIITTMWHPKAHIKDMGI